MCNYYLDLEFIAEKYDLNISKIIDIVNFNKDKFNENYDENDKVSPKI